MTTEILRVIVAGSRKFHDFEMMCTRLDIILTRAFADEADITIISGTAGGADTLGERYAALRGLKLIRMPADWKRYGKSAGYKRNVEMAQTGTHLVAFWDGNKNHSGTFHMINIGKAHRLKCRTVMFQSIASPRTDT